jgi:hypothetical protein
MRVVSSSRARLLLEALEERLVPAVNLSPLTAVPLSPIAVTSFPQQSLHIHHYHLGDNGGIGPLFSEDGATLIQHDTSVVAAQATSVTTDSAGNVYVGGWFTTDDGISSIYVAQFSNGAQTDYEVVDLRDSGGGSLFCQGVAVDVNGNISMVGAATIGEGNFSFAFVINSGFDTFLATWRFGPGNRAPQSLNAVSVDQAGEVFCTGVYSPTPTESDIEFVKLDTGFNPAVAGQAPAATLSSLFRFSVSGSGGLGTGANANGSTWAVGGYATLSANPSQSVVILGDILVVGSNPVFLAMSSDPQDTWGHDAITAVAVGNDGRQYFAGVANLSSGTTEALLIKRGAGATISPIYIHEEPSLINSAVTGIAVTATGQAVLVGTIPSTDGSGGTQGLLLLIADGGATGTLVDVAVFGDPASNTYTTGVALTSDGSIWISGNILDPSQGLDYLGQFSF